MSADPGKVSFGLMKKDLEAGNCLINCWTNTLKQPYGEMTETINNLCCTISLHKFVKPVDRLIELGANINAQDNRQRTPLYQSLKSYLANEVFKSLLKNNADLNITTYREKTILQQALTHSSPEAVHLILTKLYDEYPKNVYPSGASETEEDKRRKTSEIAKFLLNQEIDLYYPDFEYSLLLHFVLGNGDAETFKLVLNEGEFVSIDALAPQKTSLLQWALYIDESFVNCIIDFGADVNLQGDAGTALHIATDFFKPIDKVMIRYLLDQGADVNSRTAFDRYTPLHNALVAGNEEIVEMLLNAGADIGAKFFSDSYGRRQLLSSLNIVWGSTSFKQSSIKKKAEAVYSDWSILVKQAPFFDKKLIKLLLERSTNRNIAALLSCKDENNLTPLQQPCIEGHFEVAKLLIKYGADIHSKYSKGNTLLHHAVLGINENKEFLDFLIRNGLNINSQNINMETALTQVALRRPSEAVPIIEFLMDIGAYLNSPEGQKITFSGWTPLHIAVIHQAPELFECLLEQKADFRALDRDGKSPFDIQGKMHGLSKSAEVLIAFMATTDYVFPDLEHDVSLWAIDADSGNWSLQKQISCLRVFIGEANREG
ncbi:serine/threonine-protein phosphatase 6 regulatory ankyrin repeat subunit A-like [Belonocnema kinseyi]|uniref:serine/threonine-protein phosphatase 6 regulatory ankyrin repeat subunit A-like n=1 Tax=Belonocnema kinseyi TaxID=2817044 RepID=UPI00143D2D95|nr:serine/threonine-protein phosphatase 6 regulatory ankyrin repeat subunit A-like [Belonocnema kinseyi]